MRSLGVFRGIAILAVVVAHSAGYVMYVLTFWGQRFGAPRPAPDLLWVGTPIEAVLLALLQLPLFAVPVFLFSSGLFVSFVARSNSGRISWSAASRWAGNLVPAYAIWMLLATAFDVGSSSLGKQIAVESVVSTFREHVADYYFVPLLLTLFCLTPLLYRLPFWGRAVMLVPLALLTVMFFGNRTANLVGFNLSSAFTSFDGRIPGLSTFFLLGLVIGESPASVQRQVARARWLLAGAAGVLGALSILEAHALMNGDPYTFRPWQGATWLLYAAMVALAIVAWQWRGGRLRWALDWLGRNSLAIYLLQPITIELGVKAAYHTFPPVLAQSGVFPVWVLSAAIFVLVMASGLGGALVVIVALKSSPARRLERVVFGTTAAPPARRRPPPAVAANLERREPPQLRWTSPPLNQLSTGL